MQAFKSWMLLPLFIFLGLVILMWQGLGLNPQELPSVLINKPLPNIKVSQLNNSEESITLNNLPGKIKLLHIWATWCSSCQNEHAFLLTKSRQTKLPIISVIYRDQQQRALNWLKDYGNPYQLNLFDPKGDLAFELGVTGTPETYVIDQHGRIRFKKTGAFDEKSWKTLLKVARQLEEKA